MLFQKLCQWKSWSGSQFQSVSNYLDAASFTNRLENYVTFWVEKYFQPLGSWPAEKITFVPRLVFTLSDKEIKDWFSHFQTKKSKRRNQRMESETSLTPL